MIRRRSCADSGGPARVPSPVKVVRLVLCVAAHVGLKVTATHSASWCHCGRGACTMAGCGHCTWQNKELFLKGKLQAAVQLGSMPTRLLFVVGCLGLGFNASLINCRKFAWPYLGKATAAAHSYHCVQQFCVSKPWCGCQCLGFLMCTQMLMHATAHGGCMNTVRESALKVDLERKIPYHAGRTEPMTILHLAFRPNALPNESSCPCAPDAVFSSVPGAWFTEELGGIGGFYIPVTDAPNFVHTCTRSMVQADVINSHVTFEAIAPNTFQHHLQIITKKNPHKCYFASLKTQAMWTFFFLLLM